MKTGTTYLSNSNVKLHPFSRNVLVVFPRSGPTCRVAFYLSHLAGPTIQFLNGTHKSGQNGHDHGSENAGIWSCSCGGKNVRARLGHFHLNWAELVLPGRPDRTYEKRPKSRAPKVHVCP